MAHIREIRPRARELKFIVEPEVAAGIRAWARIHLDADTHGAGTFGDEYRTTSVYFDTDAYDVFYSHGSFGRSKYRIRRYGAEETVFLERKLRQPAVLAKRRTSLSLTDLPNLAEPPVEAWPGYWFHVRVTARRLRPVCQVTYSRMARSVTRNGEQARLTLDTNICVLPAKDTRFLTESAVPAVVAVPDRLILELKYRGAPPAMFRQLVEEFALTPQTASKYRLGVVALGLAQPYPVSARARIEALYA